MGITWVSCSGIHPEAITHFIPKSVKSTSQHLGSTPWTPWLRYYQQSKEKDWSDLGITWVSCSGIHPEAITYFIPKSVKSTSQHNGRHDWDIISKAKRRTGVCQELPFASAVSSVCHPSHSFPFPLAPSPWCLSHYLLFLLSQDNPPHTSSSCVQPLAFSFL